MAITKISIPAGTKILPPKYAPMPGSSTSFGFKYKKRGKNFPYEPRRSRGRRRGRVSAGDEERNDLLRGEFGTRLITSGKVSPKDPTARGLITGRDGEGEEDIPFRETPMGVARTMRTRGLVKLGRSWVTEEDRRKFLGERTARQTAKRVRERARGLDVRSMTLGGVTLRGPETQLSTQGLALPPESLKRVGAARLGARLGAAQFDQDIRDEIMGQDAATQDRQARAHIASGYEAPPQKEPIMGYRAYQKAITPPTLGGIQRGVEQDMSTQYRSTRPGEYNPAQRGLMAPPVQAASDIIQSVPPAEQARLGMMNLGGGTVSPQDTASYQRLREARGQVKAGAPMTISQPELGLQYPVAYGQPEQPNLAEANKLLAQPLQYPAPVPVAAGDGFMAGPADPTQAARIADIKAGTSLKETERDILRRQQGFPPLGQPGAATPGRILGDPTQIAATMDSFVSSIITPPTGGYFSAPLNYRDYTQMKDQVIGRLSILPDDQLIQMATKIKGSKRYQDLLAMATDLRVYDPLDWAKYALDRSATDRIVRDIDEMVAAVNGAISGRRPVTGGGVAPVGPAQGQVIPPSSRGRGRFGG